jgi:nucleoside phosphorylase
MNDQEQIHVVIITALTKELDALLRHLHNSQRVKSKGRVFYRSTISTETEGSYNIVLLSLAGMGNVNAAVATTQAIDIWNPQHVIITGIAGGIKKGSSRKLGDVIVAEQIVGYEQGRVSQTGVIRRYDVLRPAHVLLEAARNLQPVSWAFNVREPRPDTSTGRVIPQVHFGVVASGEKVIADENFLPELTSSWSRLAAVEMEGYGVALAAYQAETAPGLLLVKAICDWADSKKNDRWQEYAADVAASFTIALLKSHPFQASAKPQAIREDPPKYKGTSKITLCRRMGNDWKDLADYFDIPLHYRDGFTRGRECQDIWEWLERRSKLDGLPDGLIFISREDLVDVLLH